MIDFKVLEQLTRVLLDAGCSHVFQQKTAGQFQAERKWGADLTFLIPVALEIVIRVKLVGRVCRTHKSR